MKVLKATTDTVVELTATEAALVGGGILEKEGIRPRKFGDVDYQLYVDGALIGTGYASSTWVISSGSTNPTVHGEP
jgi:hypothetical protein